MTNILADKSVLASLNISQWSARRLDHKITDEVNQQHSAVANAGRYNKLLLETSALEPLQKVVSEARGLHITMTQPWLDNGQRILPNAMYMTYSKRFRELKGRFDEEADKFYRDYPAHIETRRKQLNGMFDASDYPPVETLRQRFGFQVVVLPVPDADDFRADLPAAQMAAIKQEVEERMQQALDNAMKDPIRRIVEYVGNMAKRLNNYVPATRTYKAEGVFKDSLVENVRELAELLPAFNMTNDPQLAKLIDRIQRDLCPNEPKTLRENSKTRKSVADAAASILADAQRILG